MIHLKHNPTLRKCGYQHYKSHSNRKFTERLCLLEISKDITTMMFHHHGCLNKIWAMLPPMDTVSWKEKVHGTSTLEREQQATGECWKWEKWSSCGKKLPIDYWTLSGHLWDHTHTGNVIQIQQIAWMYLATHTSICIYIKNIFIILYIHILQKRNIMNLEE